MQSVYEQVVTCIKKLPNERTNEEIETLCPWFSMKAQLFSTLQNDVLKDLIRNCTFSERGRDKVIIRQGDVGDCFYIILSGKVSIYINTDAVPDNPEEAQATTVDDEEGTKKEDKELDRTLYGSCVGSFPPGKGFGEIALMQKDSKRNASIIADELTHLLVINRELYNRCLRAAQEMEFRQRFDFVNGCSLFHNWQSRYKRQAAMSLRKENYSFNMPIVRQGHPLNGLTFILNGQAKIVINCLMHYGQYPDLRLHDDPEVLEKREASSAELGDQLIDVKTESKRLWEPPIRRQGYAVAEQRQAQRHNEISLVGAGETVGDVEYGMELSTYSQSVICTQDTEVYILDGKNFERLVSAKRNPRTLVQLRQCAEVKLLSRVSRSLDKIIPLVKTLVHKIVEEARQEDEKRQRESARVTPMARSLADTTDFIPTRGALIDMYGPGTVFYRNRMKRIAKLQSMRARANAHGQGGTGAGRGLALFSMSTEDYPDVPSDTTPAVVRNTVKTAPAHHGPRGHDVNDWETSSEHLGTLENRLKEWHSIMGESEKRRSKENVTMLRRFRNETAPKLIHPGTKILLRPKLNPSQSQNYESSPDTYPASSTYPDPSVAHDFDKPITNNFVSEYNDASKGSEFFITASELPTNDNDRPLTQPMGKENGKEISNDHEKVTPRQLPKKDPSVVKPVFHQVQSARYHPAPLSAFKSSKETSSLSSAKAPPNLTDPSYFTSLASTFGGDHSTNIQSSSTESLNNKLPEKVSVKKEKEASSPKLTSSGQKEDGPVLEKPSGRSEAAIEKSLNVSSQEQEHKSRGQATPTTKTVHPRRIRRTQNPSQEKGTRDDVLPVYHVPLIPSRTSPTNSKTNSTKLAQRPTETGSISAVSGSPQHVPNKRQIAASYPTMSSATVQRSTYRRDRPQPNRAPLKSVTINLNTSEDPIALQSEESPSPTSPSGVRKTALRQSVPCSSRPVTQKSSDSISSNTASQLSRSLLVNALSILNKSSSNERLPHIQLPTDGPFSCGVSTTNRVTMGAHVHSKKCMRFWMRHLDD